MQNLISRANYNGPPGWMVSELNVVLLPILPVLLRTHTFCDILPVLDTFLPTLILVFIHCEFDNFLKFYTLLTSAPSLYLNTIYDMDLKYVS